MTDPFTFVRSHPAKGQRRGIPAAGHGALDAEFLTGRIEFRFRTRTPMLAPDASRREDIPAGYDNKGKERTHPVFPLRVDAAGGPIVAPTAVRNALASMYEIVTNAPMRQFSGPRRPPDSTLWPTRSRDALSAADRVMGWGPESGSGGWRAQLAVLEVRFDRVVEGGQVSTEGRDAIRRFDGRNGLPLAVLGAPQPTKSGRYLANGEVVGRKVYLHHTPVFDDPGYWDPRRDGRVWRDKAYTVPRWSNQNRSVRGWIKPGAEFVVELAAVNLADAEAGALLWLLGLDATAKDTALRKGENRPAKHYLHIGGGRPLGFGSVQVSGLRSRLFRGAAWRDHYRRFTLDPEPPEAARVPAQALIDTYTARMAADYGEFGDIPFIAEFLAAARGPTDDQPIRYPAPRPPRR
jgi:hypothetical protein